MCVVLFSNFISTSSAAMFCWSSGEHACASRSNAVVDRRVSVVVVGGGDATRSIRFIDFDDDDARRCRQRHVWRTAGNTIVLLLLFFLYIYITTHPLIKVVRVGERVAARADAARRVRQCGATRIESRVRCTLGGMCVCVCVYSLFRIYYYRRCNIRMTQNRFFF